MTALIRIAPLAVLASLLLGPAASAQPKPAGAKTLDPCALSTSAEIAEAFGVKVSAGKVNAINAAGPQCEFVVADYGVFSVFARRDNPNDKPDIMMVELNKRKIATAEIKDVGDRSFFASPGYGMVQLNTFRGTTYLLMTTLVPGAPEAKVKAAVEKLMVKALSKIQ